MNQRSSKHKNSMYKKQKKECNSKAGIRQQTKSMLSMSRKYLRESKGQKSEGGSNLKEGEKAHIKDTMSSGEKVNKEMM